MLDHETAKKLESIVFERMKLNQPKEDGADTLTKNLSKLAVRATIITLQEYEKLNNECSE